MTSAPTISRDVASLEATLAQAIRPRGRMLTAYSGGVDSTLVAMMGRRVLGRDAAPAVIGDSASEPSPASIGLVRALSGANLLLTLAAYGLGPVLFRWRMGWARKKSSAFLTAIRAQYTRSTIVPCGKTRHWKARSFCV